MSSLVPLFNELKKEMFNKNVLSKKKTVNLYNTIQLKSFEESIEPFIIPLKKYSATVLINDKEYILNKFQYVSDYASDLSYFSYDMSPWIVDGVLETPTTYTKNKLIAELLQSEVIFSEAFGIQETLYDILNELIENLPEMNK